MMTSPSYLHAASSTFVMRTHWFLALKPRLPDFSTYTMRHARSSDAINSHRLHIVDTQNKLDIENGLPIKSSYPASIHLSRLLLQTLKWRRHRHLLGPRWRRRQLSWYLCIRKLSICERSFLIYFRQWPNSRAEPGRPLYPQRRYLHCLQRWN